MGRPRVRLGDIRKNFVNCSLNSLYTGPEVLDDTSKSRMVITSFAMWLGIAKGIHSNIITSQYLANTASDTSHVIGTWRNSIVMYKFF